MSIIDQLAQEIARLRDNPKFEVLHSDNTLVPQGSRQSGVMRRIFDDVVKMKASDSLLESLAIDDKMFVHWKRRGSSGADEIVGEFNLRSALLFAGKIDIGEPFMSENDYGTDLNTLRVVDYSAFEGGPIYALVRVDGAQVRDEIVIFDKERIVPSSLTYSTYLESLLLTRGFLHWQYLYCDGAETEQYQLDAIGRALDFLKQCFPEDDLSSLEGRFAAIRS